MPSVVSKKEIEIVLRIPFLVWNAVIFADVRKDESHLTEVLKLTTLVPESALLIKQLIARKRTLFGNDLRLLGNFNVTWKNGELNLWAEARSPFF